MRTMTRWSDDGMMRWKDEKRWMTLNLEPWTLKIDPRLSSFCYKDGLRPICLRHYPGLRPPLLKEGELRFGRAFQPWPAITNHKPLLLSFRFQVSSFRFQISSSLHLLISSSPHRLIVFHRLIASSLHRLIVSSFHRFIVKNEKRTEIPLRP